MSDSLASKLFELAQPDAPLPNGAELAFVLSELAAREEEEGGPYYTSPGKADEIDFGLNLAASIVLRKWCVELPKLESYLAKIFISELTHSNVFDTSELNELLRINTKIQNISENEPQEPELTTEEKLIFVKIREIADERFARLPKDFIENAKWVMERTIKGNPDNQMSLMSLYTKQALGKKAAHINPDWIAGAGLANIFFWSAFIVYDDFWDVDEAADPKLLPVANLFARHFTHFFTSTGSHKDNFTILFNRYMDELDSANEWEMLFCRMPLNDQGFLIPSNLPEYGDFGIKFYPAAGHIFGPINIFLQLGYSLDSKEVQLLTEYFRGYLIAMQLNDDAHDWKEDLYRGHISTAVYLILKNWRERYPDHNILDLGKDMPELERIFWIDIMPQLCKLIFEQTNHAQNALDSMDCIENPEPLQKFIDRNTVSAEKAMSEQIKSIEFLQEI